MGKIWMPGGGGGADTSVVTAEAGDVLMGKVIVGPDGEPLTGTMPNRGAVSYSLPINGSYPIENGYHNGSGKVTQDIPVQGGSTTTPGTAAKTIVAAGRYVSGNIIVAGSSNLVAANIKKGVNIFGVVGTHSGYVATAQDLYIRGQNPSNFTRYYGGSGSPVFDSGQITIMDINSLIYAQNQVALTGYSKFNVELKRGSTDSDFDGTVTIGQYDSGYSFTGPTLKYTLPNSVGNYTISIDISSFQKTFSTKFGVFFQYLSTSYAPGAVYRIWLS